MVLPFGRFLKTQFELHKCIDVALTHMRTHTHAADVWRPKTLNENIRIELIESREYCIWILPFFHTNTSDTSEFNGNVFIQFQRKTTALLLNYSWNYNWKMSFCIRIEQRMAKKRCNQDLEWMCNTTIAIYSNYPRRSIFTTIYCQPVCLHVRTYV